MKITRIQVKNYRGIAARDIAVAPGGMIAKGANGRGKTSILKAIRAALGATDIGADAIHLGADKAEILIDIDAFQVRRSITAKGNTTLTVKQGEMTAAKPQGLLGDMLGTSPFDPLDFFLAKSKERRTILLEAMPVTAGDDFFTKYDLDGLFVGDARKGHGLEVLSRVRKHYYDARTVANKASKEAARVAADLAQAVAKTPTDDPAITVAGANDELRAANDRLVALHERRRAAAAREARSATTRARIAQLREDAAHQACVAKDHPGELSITRAKEVLAAANEEVENLRLVLEEAEAAARDAKDALEKVNTDAAAAWKAARDAEDFTAQAAALENVLEAGEPAPTEDELATAEAVRVAATDAVKVAGDVETGREMRKRLDAAQAKQTDAERYALKLDEIVQGLTDRAPAELLATTEGIPGVTLEGDAIYLQGKDIDALSGAEQMKFAIDLARKLNAKAKILIVDKLEALDPDQMDAFVSYATRDDWQLLGTRVDRGEIVIEAIEPDAEEAAEE